ncbi:unnamed protein product [Adineta steineri]|uniref:Lipase domain-containing protein n=1 Tax=Adineta steineri TaxID=433720 RepID=A0A814R4L3_9BILA|nr:unnamed protein product [Adineta steineri]
MAPEASFYGLSIILLIHCIDARLAPLQHMADKPLTIDAISANYIPIISSENQINKRQTTGPKPNTTVCYPLVGCFDNNDPFNNAGLEVPQAPEFIETAFLLFTQESPTNPEFLLYDDDDSIRKVDVNPSRWLRIIIHGFSNNHDSVWMNKMKNELLKLKNDELSDVLIVGWGNGAKFPFYPNAVANTRLVGKQIGVLLERLHELKGISFNKVHCIADLGKLDYAIVYFHKAKTLFGWGGQKGDEIIISRLRIRSLEDTLVYSGRCDTSTSVAAYTSQTLLLNRFDCHD